MRVLMIAALCAGLGGCAGNWGYVLDTYTSSQGTNIETPNGTYRIWDRPDLGKVLTSPSIGSAIALGAVSGLTFMAVKIDPVVQAHQTAAKQFLASTGRNCEIKTSSEILRPEYEHTYLCR